MDSMSSNDPYLKKRLPISDNMDNAYLLEVNGLCPLCGKHILTTKGKRFIKKYHIAHIYPNSPTLYELFELQDIERLGTDCEDFQNKIALCKDCHGYYDDNKTKEEYLNLVKIKKNLMSKSQAKSIVSNQDLEQEIILVINKLSSIDEQSLKKMKLEYQALKISEKIEKKYSILKLKIENYVCIYYNFIKETFQNLDQSQKINFNLVASEVKTSFLKCEMEMSNKSEIFESLVKWINSKIKDSSIEACEAIVSYFVQSCEVFHEITE